MEASFGWGWLADELLAAGLRPQLSNCYKVEQMRKARGWAKTNTKDADLLSLLSAEKDDWWRVWMAPPEVRDRREWMRYRTGLVRIQTQTKNRISALCHRHGIFHEFSDLFGVHGRAFLAELCREGKHVGGQLLPGALAALGSHLRLLTHVRKQLADVDAGVAARAGGDAAGPAAGRDSGPRADPGAHAVEEIGELERFRNHRALALYVAWRPCPTTPGKRIRRERRGAAPGPSRQPDAEVGVHRGGARGGA